MSKLVMIALGLLAIMLCALVTYGATGTRVLVWTCTVSEPVVIKDRAKLKIGNGTLSSFRFPTPQSMTVYVRPKRTGWVSLTFDDGFCADLSGNTNAAVTSQKYAWAWP